MKKFLGLYTKKGVKAILDEVQEELVDKIHTGATAKHYDKKISKIVEEKKGKV